MRHIHQTLPILPMTTPWPVVSSIPSSPRNPMPASTSSPSKQKTQLSDTTLTQNCVTFFPIGSNIINNNVKFKTCPSRSTGQFHPPPSTQEVSSKMQALNEWCPIPTSRPPSLRGHSCIHLFSRETPPPLQSREARNPQIQSILLAIILNSAKGSGYRLTRRECWPIGSSTDIVLFY